MQTALGITLKRVIQTTGVHMVWLLIYMSGIAILHDNTRLEWLIIPWVPVSLIGTAVAFYLGFKTNSAYDRMWEARKIWGAIVNSSRAFAATTKNFVNNQESIEKLSDMELNQVHRRLIHRHIAWLYAHRQQLLKITEWEHAAQKSMLGAWARRLQRRFGMGYLGLCFLQCPAWMDLYGHGVGWRLYRESFSKYVE